MKTITFILAGLLATTAFGKELQGELSGNLPRTNSPYRVTQDITIRPGTSLIIESGVVLKFDSTVVFRVAGKLTAKGSATSPILFTSSRPNPTGAAWEGIQFTNRSDNSSELEHCQIEFSRRGISLFSVSPKIQHCTITRNADDGIFCQVSQATIAYNLIQENGRDGIHASMFTGSILNNEISGNQGDGIHLEKSNGVIANNKLIQNGDDGVFCKQSNDLVRENFIMQNHDDGILVEGAGPKIVNNTIGRNRFGIFGYNAAHPLIVNNTIADNIYGLYSRGATVLEVENTIVWRNETNVFTDSVSTAQITFSNIQGGFPGSGNLNNDPKFLNPESYQLRPDSPCLGRGNPNPIIESTPNSKNMGSGL